MKKLNALFVIAALAAVTAGTLALAKPGPPPPPKPDCKFVLCAYPDCLPTEHTEIPPGQCCPVCVPN